MSRPSEASLMRRVLVALVAAYALVAQGVLGGALHAGTLAGHGMGDIAHIHCLPSGGAAPAMLDGGDVPPPHDDAGHLPDCCMAGCATGAMALPAPACSGALHHELASALVPAAADTRVTSTRPHERPLVRGPPGAA
jgi:hypothetical protein